MFRQYLCFFFSSVRHSFTSNLNGRKVFYFRNLNRVINSINQILWIIKLFNVSRVSTEVDILNWFLPFLVANLVLNCLVKYLDGGMSDSCNFLTTKRNDEIWLKILNRDYFRRIGSSLMDKFGSNYILHFWNIANFSKGVNFLG